MAMSDRFLPLAHTPERATSETALTRAVLIAIALLFLAAILFLGIDASKKLVPATEAAT